MRDDIRDSVPAAVYLSLLGGCGGEGQPPTAPVSTMPIIVPERFTAGVFLTIAIYRRPLPFHGMARIGCSSFVNEFQAG